MESEKKIVLNEVLCYITNRIDVLDEPTLTWMLVTNFSEKDIDEAKANKCENLTLKSITRKGEGKASKNALDMIKIIKEIGAASEKLPLYVARDLHKIPPYYFWPPGRHENPQGIGIWGHYTYFKRRDLSTWDIQT